MIIRSVFLPLLHNREFGCTRDFLSCKTSAIVDIVLIRFVVFLHCACDSRRKTRLLVFWNIQDGSVTHRHRLLLAIWDARGQRSDMPMHVTVAQLAPRRTI